MNNITPLINETLSREMQSTLFLLSSYAHRYSFTVYAAGDFVRNLLQGKENHYINLVVENFAIDYARKLTELFPGKIHCCDRIGTARLVTAKGVILDMVTAKDEFSPFSSNSNASAKEEKASLKRSLYNRDFTINAIACSLNRDEYGRLYDFFGGLQDLRQREIRVFNKLSFVNDPLLLLRALLLAQKLSFKLEGETFSLLQSACKNHQLRKISKEKLYREIGQIFNSKYPSKILKQLHSLGVLSFIFPRVIFDRDMINNIGRLETLLLDNYWINKRNDLHLFVVYLSLIMQNLSEHDRKYLLYLLRLRKLERQKIVTVLDSLPRIITQITAPEISEADLNSHLKILPREGFPLVEAVSCSSIASRRIKRYLEHLDDIKQ